MPASMGDPYTPDESAAVHQALRTHRATTQTAERALKTAERTRELANATLADLHDQGDQLARVQGDLNTIDADVEESRTVIKYMRRCCLFFLCSCCCECDPDAERDRMRKARVRARRAAGRKEVEARARVEARKAADAAARDGVAAPEEAGGEAAARAALFGRPAAPERKGMAYQIGKGLDEPDREALHAETDAQEKAFDRIGDALADLKRLGGEMQTELARQAPTIERVGDRAQRARDDILHVSKSAAKGFGVKEVRGPTTASAAAGTSAAAARAAAEAAGKSLGL